MTADRGPWVDLSSRMSASMAVVVAGSALPCLCCGSYSLEMKGLTQNIWDLHRKRGDQASSCVAEWRTPLILRALSHIAIPYHSCAPSADKLFLDKASSWLTTLGGVLTPTFPCRLHQPTPPPTNIGMHTATIHRHFTVYQYTSTSPSPSHLLHEKVTLIRYTDLFIGLNTSAYTAVLFKVVIRFLSGSKGWQGERMRQTQSTLINADCSG